MNEAKAMATLAVFAVGIVAGIVVHAIVDQGPPASPYAELQRIDEPRVANEVVAAIAADDALTLSRLLSADMLGALDSALQPVVSVRKTEFVGAVESEGRLLSGYVVTGKTTDGIDFAVGFVLRVANDQVVGVN